MVGSAHISLDMRILHYYILRQMAQLSSVNRSLITTLHGYTVTRLHCGSPFYLTLPSSHVTFDAIEQDPKVR